MRNAPLWLEGCVRMVSIVGIANGESEGEKKEAQTRLPESER
jgi:hypothetical protein